MLGEDIIQACVAAPKPVLVFAHPASGTKWLQQQLKHALDGDVAHENMLRRAPEDFQAVITFKHWKPESLSRFATVFACTRNPLDVIRSSLILFKQPHIRSAITMELFADSLPRGQVWRELQQLEFTKLPLFTLMKWYELAEYVCPRPEQWFRIEDAKEIVQAPKNTKSARSGIERPDWNQVLTVGGRGSLALAEYAKTHGYPEEVDAPGRDVGGVIGCSTDWMTLQQLDNSLRLGPSLSAGPDGPSES